MIAAVQRCDDDVCKVIQLAHTRVVHELREMMQPADPHTPSPIRPSSIPTSSASVPAPSTQMENDEPTEEVLPLTEDRVQHDFTSLEMGTSETVCNGRQAAAFDPMCPQGQHDANVNISLTQIVQGDNDSRLASQLGTVIFNY